MSTPLSIEVPGQGKVSALWDKAKDEIALLVLAHGAGAGMSHPGIAQLAQSLNDVGVSTLRFQFPYMEKKSKRPDRPEVAVSAIAAAVQTARKKAPKLPLFAGGRSFGGRMTTTAASLGKLPEISGIVCFSFPLHPPKKPGTERAAHLKEVKAPILFLQGTRDDLADFVLLKKVVKAHPHIQLVAFEGADHSFHVLKSSGRNDEEIRELVAKACREWIYSKIITTRR